MRLLAACLVLAAPLAAQPAAPDARALVAAGDTAAAYDALRAAPTADSADLRRLRLRLELDGQGPLVQQLPRPARQGHFVEGARRLLALAPDDTLALRVLAGDHVLTTLGWRDRVELGHITTPVGRFVEEEEVRARQVRSRFTSWHRRAMAPDLDRSARAREAHVAALALLDRWLAADPGAAPAYRLAAVLAAGTRQWDGLLAVATRYAGATADPRAGLLAGLAHERLGDADAAEAAFERAFARLPAERARHDDVRSLLPRSLRAAYDADPEATTRAFWAEADPRLLTAVNERRAEHRARVVEADLLFGLLAGEDRWRLGSASDQGRIWVRYGPPAESVKFVATDGGVPVYTNHSWPIHAVWDYPDFQFVFHDGARDGDYHTFVPPTWAFRETTSARNDDFVAQDQRMQESDPQRTQVAPERPLAVPALASRFRTPGGGLDVVVGWGVPTDLAPVRTGAFSLARGVVLDRVAETRQRLGPGRAAGGLWAEAATVRLPSAGTVRVEVEADSGRAFGSAAFDLAPLADGGGLAVSDLLLALSVDEDGSGPVVRYGVGITPAPRAAFSTNDAVWVYLEAYGLSLRGGRSRYSVEATLRPEARRGGLLGRIFGRGQDPGVSVRTEAGGDRSTEAVTFFIAVGDQDPGRYTLAVEVRDEATGQTASAEREVVLE